MGRKNMSRLAVRVLVDLRPHLKGWTDPTAIGIGRDGAICAAARRSDEALTFESGIGIFPKSNLDAPTDYLILRWHEDRVKTFVHRGEALVVSFIQPFPNGVFLAGGRCRWTPKAIEKNALVLDWEGNEVRRFTLGDGIQDLRVTESGAIWASYFDEGIFGNYGWGHPGPRPIGAPGLVAFSPCGDVVQSYVAEAAGTDSICDAYAMNVVGERELWVYFYTEFPIVRVRNGEYRSWEFGVGGARALAVQEPRVLLFGDYKKRNLARVVELGEEGGARVVQELEVIEDGGAAVDGSIVYGVGGTLYFFSSGRILIADTW
jgi:hypothetical protein